MDIIQALAEEFKLKREQVEKTVALIDEGNTIPFIARYRKEETGSLDDTVLRDLDDRLTYLRNIEKRKEEVRSLITEMGKMTDEIAQALEKATTLAELEDIYRPYKPKRRTRASIAKEKGLDVNVQTVTLKYSGRYIAENEHGYGILKVITDKKHKNIVGLHMIGSYASEIIYGAAMMVETEMRVEDIQKIVFPHPTVCEVIRESMFM